MAKKSDIEKQIDVVDGVMSQDQADQPDYEPVYRQYENTRIPVSKHMGTLWKSRHREAKMLLDNLGMLDRWDEAIAYYKNDQGGRSNKQRRLTEAGTGKSSEALYGTENVVFANVSALVPATYAKNPNVEVTHTKQGNEKKARLFEALLDALFRRKVAPGMNIKPRMRRALVTTMLTNISYLDLSYIRKEDSSDEAVENIKQISQQLEKAKDAEEIKELEGKLLALDEKVYMLGPSGPKLSFRSPDKVFVDPDSNEPDLCDANYIIVGQYVRTSYIRAMYGKRDDKGDWLSIYKPTHVISADKADMGHSDHEDIDNFRLLSDGAEHETYGYRDKEAFNQGCRTLVWNVWDKVTRRVYMFNDADWTWPIWVWDDPYNLSRFYPIFPLTFYTDPKDTYARSEVMYYLDQQDEINRIGNERARMRHWAMSKLFVDSNSVKDASTVQRFLDPMSEDYVLPIDLPDGKRISDIIGSLPAPSTQFEGLFDTEPLYQAINRMSSVTPIMRNIEFKTNTTNKAIETYESGTQMRLDEKIDAVEDVMAEIAGATLEMCVQFMDEQTVIELLGSEFVNAHGGWQQMTVEELHTNYNLMITGGSTLKPTSRVKKDQAMQLSQILGQFANASPMLVVIMLKMLERAFNDDVVITPEEWEAIVGTTMQNIQQSQQQQQQGAQGAPQQGQQQQAQPAEQGGDINAVMAQVEQVIQQLPPEAKQALGEGIARGIPLKELVSGLLQQAQQGNQPTQ